MTTLPQSREGVILHFQSLVQERIAAVTVITADPEFNPIEIAASELEFLTGLLDLIKRSL